MIAMLQDQARPIEERLRAMEVLAVMESTEAARAVTGLLAADGTPAPLIERAFAHVRRQLFSLWIDARKSPEVAIAIRKALRTPGLQAGGVELASAVGDPQFGPDLLALARSASADEAVRAAAVDVVALDRGAASLDDLDALLTSGPPAVRASAMYAIGLRAPPDLEARAEAVMLGDAPNDVRSQAVRVLARTPAGLDRLVAIEQAGKFPPELKRVATGAVRGPVPPAFRNVTGNAARPRSGRRHAAAGCRRGGGRLRIRAGACREGVPAARHEQCRRRADDPSNGAELPRRCRGRTEGVRHAL